MKRGTCKQGVYVKNTVNGAEGLVIGKAIWMYGCEKMIIMPTYFNENALLPDPQRQRYMASEEYLELTGESSEYEQDFDIPNTERWFGKKCRDKVTGIEGTVIACLSTLFNADQYSLEWKNKKGKVDADWFDEGRLEIIGESISPEDVSSSRPGGSDICLPVLDLPAYSI